MTRQNVLADRAWASKGGPRACLSVTSASLLPLTYISTAVSATCQLPALLEDIRHFPYLAKNKPRALLGICRWYARSAMLGFSPGSVTQKCGTAYITSLGEVLLAPLGKAHKQKPTLRRAFLPSLKASEESGDTGLSPVMLRGWVYSRRMNLLLFQNHCVCNGGGVVLIMMLGYYN